MLKATGTWPGEGRVVTLTTVPVDCLIRMAMATALSLSGVVSVLVIEPSSFAAYWGAGTTGSGTFDAGPPVITGTGV